MPFLACLPAAFVATAIAGLVLERTLYSRVYGRPHLDHVLFSIGLVFMAVAAVDYTMGSQQQVVRLPPWLQGRFDVAGHRDRQLSHVSDRRSAACLPSSLQLAVSRTRFGSRLRAAVDDRRVARGLGIPVNSDLRDDVRRRLGTRWPGWRARRGTPRPRPDLSTRSS